MCLPARRPKQLDFETGGGTRSEPCGFGQREVAFRGDPRIGGCKLHLDLTLEFAQSGVTGLHGEQSSRREEEHDALHNY